MDVRLFFGLTVASGLLNRTEVPAIRRDLAGFRDRFASDVDGLSFLKTYLIQRGVLTRWQCSKLAEGRYKGFFIGRYKLLDDLGGTETNLVYLVENTDSQQRAEMHIMREARVDRFLVFQGGKFIEELFMRPREGGA